MRYMDKRRYLVAARSHAHLQKERYCNLLKVRAKDVRTPAEHKPAKVTDVRTKSVCDVGGTQLFCRSIRKRREGD